MSFHPHVVVIGADDLGATVALHLARSERCRVTLLDPDADRAAGKALDITEAGPVLSFDAATKGTGGYGVLSKAAVIVLAPPTALRTDTTAADRLQTAGNFVCRWAPIIDRHTDRALVVVAGEPSSVLCSLVAKRTAIPDRLILGVTGILESARFCRLIGRQLRLSHADVSAMVIGGSGALAVPLPDHASVHGVPLSELMNRTEINALVELTRDAARNLRRTWRRDAGYYGVAAAVSEAVQTFLQRERRLLSLTAHDTTTESNAHVFHGRPAILGGEGVEQIIQLDLTPMEQALWSEYTARVQELRFCYDQECAADSEALRGV